MKTFFKVSMLGLLMVIFTAVSFTPAIAQDDEQKEKTALYTCFVDNYDKPTIEQRQKALDCAKQYVAKFPDDKQYVDYFKPQIEFLDKWIIAEKERIRQEDERKKRQARFARFDKAYKAAVKTTETSAWSEVFDAGQAIISNDKDFALDTKILLAAAPSAYLVEIQTPNNNFNNQIINYAEAVYRDVSAGKSSKNFGVYNFTFKTKDNTLGEMQRILGVIKFFRQEKKDEGVKHFYKAVQYNGDTKKDPQVYRYIGSWYRSKAAKLGKEREGLDLKVEENIEKAKKLLAMEKAYVERAIDAYARAYKLSSMDPKISAEKKKELYNNLKALFAFRYTDKEDELKKTDANINSYVSSISSKAMPSPATEVTPVKLEKDPPSDATDKTNDDTKTDTTGATRSRTVSKKTKDN